MGIERWDEKKEGALSETALRKKLEKKGYTVTKYVYSPRTNFPDHTHVMDKIDAVVSGRFHMKMNGLDVILESGDCLAVPRGTVHSAEVIGNESVISLDAVKES